MTFQPPRTAFFLPDLRMGGAERTMSLLANGLAQRGIPVDFVLVRAKGAILDQLAPEVRVVDLKAQSAYQSLPGLVNYLHATPPDVMISAMDLTNLIAILARKISGAPTRLAVRLDSTVSLQPRSPIKKKLERHLLSFFYPQADEIIAVSKSVARDFSAYTGIAPAHVRTIYNPVILPDLPERMRLAIEHPWFAPGQPPVILGVGRLVETKDFSTLLKAFQQVHAQTPSRLMLLGEGSQRPVLEALAASLQVSEDFALPGNVSNPYPYLSRAAVMASASRLEGLPTAIIEAMACGCPVVATDCPSGPAEVLDGGRFGSLVPVGDANALAQAILDVLKNGGRRADPEWLKPFTLDRVVDQYLQIFES
jgi:glycosyltransferase involved in cell wall biosynthesis